MQLLASLRFDEIRRKVHAVVVVGTVSVNMAAIYTIETTQTGHIAIST